MNYDYFPTEVTVLQDLISYSQLFNLPQLTLPNIPIQDLHKAIRSYL